MSTWQTSRQGRSGFTLRHKAVFQTRKVKSKDRCSASRMSSEQRVALMKTGSSPGGRALLRRTCCRRLAARLQRSLWTTRRLKRTRFQHEGLRYGEISARDKRRSVWRRCGKTDSTYCSSFLLCWAGCHSSPLSALTGSPHACTGCMTGQTQTQRSGVKQNNCTD